MTTPTKGGKNTGSASRGSLPPPPLGRERVGRYEVLYPLAQGGMASVHVGRLSGMAGFEKLVAIKVIHPHLAGEQAFVNMFLDEARLAAGIRHPSVAEVHEIGEDDGLLFMACELVLGKSVRALYRQAARQRVDIPLALSADVAARACRGLHCAHELTDPDGAPLNLVHRDISPGNVLVSYDGFVKLIDFGVAWAQGRLAQTEVGTLKGKIGYMSPEQVRGERLDRRSDIFSLGVTLYLMVTGSHPFPGETEMSRIQKVLAGEPVPPRQINPRIGPELEGIVLTALAGAPERRYPTAAVMADELERFTRSVDRQVGSAALADLMHAVFADELVAERERQREHRREAAPAPGPAPVAPDGPTPPTNGAADEEDRTIASTPQAIREREPHPPRPSSRRVLVAALIGAAVLALALVALTPVFSDTTGEGPGAAVDPDPATTATSETPVPAPGAATHDERSAAPDSETKTVLITLDVQPAGSALRLDGEPLANGTTELRLPADGARHAVEASAPGHAGTTREIKADRDGALTIRLKPHRGRGKPTRGRPGSGKIKEDLELIGSPYE